MAKPADSVPEVVNDESEFKLILHYTTNDVFVYAEVIYT